MKINVDVAFKSGKVGFGFVLRDDRGILLQSGAGRLENISSAIHAELMGTWQSFRYATQCQRGSFIIETDSQVLVKQITSTEQDLSPLGGIVNRFRALFRNSHPLAMVIFCLSIANRAAHLLAKKKDKSHFTYFMGMFYPF